MSKSDASRDLFVDGAKASPLVAYLISIVNGVDWGAVAAMLAAIYSAILIGEKVWRYVVQPLRRRLKAGGAS